MDKFSIQDMCRTPGWQQVETYIADTLQVCASKLLITDPNNVVEIARLQGRHNALTTLLNTINKFKED